MEVRDALENIGYEIRSAEIEMVPKTFQTLGGKEAETILKLMDALEENDDINKLYSNFNVDESSMLDV
jgi:transcriptional/translational regulatory protein YebC/TACO1